MTPVMPFDLPMLRLVLGKFLVWVGLSCCLMRLRNVLKYGLGVLSVHADAEGIEI